MTSLPTGNVTFFLADVEGSTRLQENEHVNYPVVLGSVRSILRTAIIAHGGLEVDAVGDEVLAVFTAPRPAAEAALEAQRAMRDAAWPHDLIVRVRIGLHTGTPSYGEEGYTGIDIVRAARISQTGHGGQVVASEAMLEALDGMAVRDLGEHRIEGLTAPERLYQLLADDLARDFPALRHTSSTLGGGVRVVIADDSVLLREGVVLLLTEAGFDVVAQSGTADDLLRHVAMHKPAVAVVDIRMPPTHTDEGLRAAAEIRARFPGTGVLVLSQYVETGYALELLAESAEGVGYLLKDRVSDVEQFASSVRRVAEGGSALDPDVVSQLIGRRRRDDPLEQLTPREREVLELMAEGRSNQAIADRLFVTLRAVEKHVTSIFTKLGLPASTEDHRRVLAVLASLRVGPRQRLAAAEALEALARLGVEPVAEPRSRPPLLRLGIAMARRLELGQEAPRGDLQHLLPRHAAHRVVGGHDADLLGAAILGREALEEVVRMRGPPHLERSDSALDPGPVEDDDSARATPRDEAREEVDELVRVGPLARVQQVVAVEEVQGRIGHQAASRWRRDS